MRQKLTTYNNAVVCRGLNKRVIILQKPYGYFITIKRLLEKDEVFKGPESPSQYQKGRILYTHLKLTPEAMAMFSVAMIGAGENFGIYEKLNIKRDV